jgi:hypothetical protein
MGSIVTYVNLIALVRTAHTIGKLQVLGTVELVQYVAHQVEYDHTHHFALDHNYAILGVHTNAARVLEYGGAEFAHKLTVLIVYLYLMRGRALSDHNVACGFDNSNAIRIQQLAFAFATLAKFELESALFVEYLNAMRIGIGHHDVIVAIDGHA